MQAPQATQDDRGCIQCGYSLHGLSDERCPECGKTFDPADPLSMRTPEYWRWCKRLTFLSLTAWIVAVVAMYVAMQWVLPTSYNRVQNLRFVVPAMIIGWIARRMVRRHILRSRSEVAPRSEHAFTIATWLLVLPLFLAGCGGIREWNCPHGWARGIGPVGIAASPVGGPCRNFIPNLRAWHVSGNWYVWFDPDLGAF